MTAFLEKLIYDNKKQTCDCLEEKQEGRDGLQRQETTYP